MEEPKSYTYTVHHAFGAAASSFTNYIYVPFTPSKVIVRYIMFSPAGADAFGANVPCAAIHTDIIKYTNANKLFVVPKGSQYSETHTGVYIEHKVAQPVQGNIVFEVKDVNGNAVTVAQYSSFAFVLEFVE